MVEQALLESVPSTVTLGAVSVVMLRPHVAAPCPEPPTGTVV